MNHQMNFVLPELYDKFLSELGETGEFVIENSGIILYAKADLVERNTTYEIEEWEPDFFMIGQEGDLAFFIKKDSDDTVYMNDLGALGLIEMNPVASMYMSLFSVPKRILTECERWILLFSILLISLSMSLALKS